MLRARYCFRSQRCVSASQTHGEQAVQIGKISVVVDEEVQAFAIFFARPFGIPGVEEIDIPLHGEIDAEVAGSADELGEGTCQMRKPSETFRQFIEPAYDDYLKDPLSERLANNLAAALNHQVDWTFIYYKAVDPSRLDGAPEVKSFRRKLSVQCQPLQIMNDLADAAEGISSDHRLSGSRRSSTVNAVAQFAFLRRLLQGLSLRSGA